MVNDYKFYTCIRNLRNVCKHVHPGVSNDCDSIENISLSISVWRKPRYELTKLTGLQQEPLPTESVSTIHFKHPTAAQWTCTHSTTCTTRHGTSRGHLRSLSVLNRANKSTSSLYASIAWYPITQFLYRVASPCTVVIVLFIYLCHFLVPDRANIISQSCSKICGRLY